MDDGAAPLLRLQALKHRQNLVEINPRCVHGRRRNDTVFRHVTAGKAETVSVAAVSDAEFDIAAFVIATHGENAHVVCVRRAAGHDACVARLACLGLQQGKVLAVGVEHAGSARLQVPDHASRQLHEVADNAFAPETLFLDLACMFKVDVGDHGNLGPIEFKLLFEIAHFGKFGGAVAVLVRQAREDETDALETVIVVGNGLVGGRQCARHGVDHVLGGRLPHTSRDREERCRRVSPPVAGKPFDGLRGLIDKETRDGRIDVARPFADDETGSSPFEGLVGREQGGARLRSLGSCEEFGCKQETGQTLFNGVETVPEPATMAALGLGLAAVIRRRKK